MEYKYTLIVSQYYHSRHFFIVEHKPDFIEKARLFAKELMHYKRDEGRKEATRECELGDLDPKYVGDEIRSRYNINDSGDIYFLQALYANRCMSEANKYHEDSIRQSKGYIKKYITQAIEKHHDYREVKEIVEKYFNII